MSNFGVDYTAEDQSEVVQGGGGDFKSLIHTKEAEGPVLLRFIGYIETGLEAKQQGEGADDKVQLQFEVVSPRHVKNGTKDDGAEYSIRERLTVYLKKGTNSKSGFVNFFQAMDYGRGNTHFTQMLGEAFLADLFAKTSTTGVVDPKGRNVIHDGWNGKYTIRAPITTDAISNESVNIPVPEARYPQQCFVWNQPNKAMWDSIQIGDKAEDDETNFIKSTIKKALNFAGSPVEAFLAGGTTPAQAVAEKPAKKKKAAAKKAVADDPLAALGL